MLDQASQEDGAEAGARAAAGVSRPGMHAIWYLQINGAAVTPCIVAT